MLALALVVGAVAPACVQASDVRPDCRAPTNEAILTLAAQAVPTATVLPCLDVLLTGWDFAGWEAVDGEFRFWLSSDRGGLRPVEVALLSSCDVSGAVEVQPAPDEAGTRRYELPLSLDPTMANRYYVFPGGCIRVEYRFTVARASSLILEADQAIGFRPRRPLVDRLRELGFDLCGAGAPECPGGD